MYVQRSIGSGRRSSGSREAEGRGQRAEGRRQEVAVSGQRSAVSGRQSAVSNQHSVIILPLLPLPPPLPLLLLPPPSPSPTSAPPSTSPPSSVTSCWRVWGMELDHTFATLCGKAQGDPQQSYPTFNLLLRALPEADWSACTPESPLRRWQLIQMEPGRTLTQSPLRD